MDERIKQLLCKHCVWILRTHIKPGDAMRSHGEMGGKSRRISGSSWAGQPGYAAENSNLFQTM